MNEFIKAMRTLHREHQKALRDAKYWKTQYEALRDHVVLSVSEELEQKEQEERNRE